MTISQMNNDGSSRVISWPGDRDNIDEVNDKDDSTDYACIEERATLRPGKTGSRLDMDVDTVPTADTKTQWKPYLPGLVYGRNSFLPAFTDAEEAKKVKDDRDYIASRWEYGPTSTRDELKRLGRRPIPMNYYTPSTETYLDTYNSCPAPARLLAPINRAGLDEYLERLRPTGYTYPDIGFVWGLRLMSPTGLFKEDHEEWARKHGQVARHLIFMSDGKTDTRIGAYDAWGVSAVARRRTSDPETQMPTDDDQNELTDKRFLELCTFAKEQMNITVWVIAFGDEVLAGGGGKIPPLLEQCASEGRAYSAKDKEQLEDAFSDISSKIAALRITH